MGFVSNLWDAHVRRTRAYRMMSKEYSRMADMVDKAMDDLDKQLDELIAAKQTIHKRETQIADLLRNTVPAEKHNQLTQRHETLSALNSNLNDSLEVMSSTINKLRDRIYTLENPPTYTTTTLVYPKTKYAPVKKATSKKAPVKRAAAAKVKATKRKR